MSLTDDMLIERATVRGEIQMRSLWWRMSLAAACLALGFSGPASAQKAGRAPQKSAATASGGASTTRLVKCAAIAALNGTANATNGVYEESYPTKFSSGALLKLIDRDPKLKSLENRGYVLSRLFGTGRARSVTVDTVQREISVAENDYAPTLLRDHIALSTAAKGCSSEAANVASEVDFNAELAKIGAKLEGYVGDYQNVNYDDICAIKRRSVQANSYVAGLPDDYCKRARPGGPLDTLLKSGKAREDAPVPFDPSLDTDAPTATPTIASGSQPCPNGTVPITNSGASPAPSGSKSGSLSRLKDSNVGKVILGHLPSWMRRGAATADSATSTTNPEAKPPTPASGCASHKIQKAIVARSSTTTLEKFTDGLMVLFLVVQPEGPGELVDEAILLQRATLARELEQSGSKVVDMLIDGKIEGQMAARGWTEEEMFQLREGESSGTSFDDTVKGQRDPATVYGDKNGYMVVNDRTGKVAAISDKTDPNWKIDSRIEWHK